MTDRLVDFSFLEELSGGARGYKCDVLNIFLATVDEGLANLGQLIKKSDDFDAIFKQAHALKSSAGIIKVQDMYDRLAKIEELGRLIAEKGAETGKEEIREIFDLL